MLEGLLALVLNRYVGEYLDDINTDNLSIALLSGQVELENVPLKKKALSKLELPISLKSGVVGKLTLKIPITSLRSEPWIVKLSDVLILLESSFDDYDEEYIQKCEVERKEKLLSELEELHKKAILKKIKSLSIQEEDEKNQWWGASIITSIINNIHLIIDNIHIKYEDNETLPKPFSCGIRIQNVTVNTSNNLWRNGFINNDNEYFSYKKLNIKGVSFYWNGHEQEISTINNIDDLRNLLLPENYKNNCNVIKSLSLRMRMTKNLSKLPLLNENTPRFKIDIRPSKLDIEITTLQLNQFRALSKEWSRIDRAKNFRKWRPSTPVIGNAKKWWIFAINCIKEPISKVITRKTLKYTCYRAKLVNQYVKTYQKRLVNFLKNKINDIGENGKTLMDNLSLFKLYNEGEIETISDKAFIKQIERGNEINYYELSILRDVLTKKIMNIIENDLKNISLNNINIEEEKNDFEELEKLEISNNIIEDPTTTTGNLYGWLTSWISGNTKNCEILLEDEDNKFFDKEEDFSSIKSNVLPPNLKKIEQQVEQDLFEALNETWDDTAVFTRDKILANLTFQIDRIILRIISETKINDIPASRCLTMDMSKVSSRVLFSARERRTNVLLTTNNFNIQCTKVTSLFNDNALSEIDNTSRISFDGDFDKENHEIYNVQEDNDSMLGLFGETTDVDVAQIMFAIGRSKYGLSYETNNETMSPILIMNYTRFAPKSTVFHDLNAELQPISVTYDESAIDDLYNMFGIKRINDEDFQNFTENVEIKENEIKMRENNFYCHFKMPVVEIELKTKRKNLFNDEECSSVGESFATLMMEEVNVGLAKSEQHITKYKFSSKNMCLRDMYDNKFSKLLEIQKRKGLEFTKIISKSNPTLNSTTNYSFKKVLSLNDLSDKTFDNDIDQEVIIERNKEFNKKVSRYMSSDFEMSDNDQLLLSIISVNPKHPQFKSKYKEIELNIDGQMSNVTLGMNRRSWILIQDFIGLIPKPKIDKMTFNNKDIELFQQILQQNEKEGVKKVFSTNIFESKEVIKNSSNININLNMDTLKILMNYPRANSCLGSIDLEEINLSLVIDKNNDTKPMIMDIGLKKLLVHNNTPGYSCLYPTPISIIKNKKDTNRKGGIKIKIEKNRMNDNKLVKPFDMEVSLNISEEYKFVYIHTQRFLLALSEFWNNYSDLQEQITKKRLCEDDENESKIKGRISLKFNINNETIIVLPLNQFSNQCIILKSTSLKLSNKFELASRTKFYDDHVIERNAMQDDTDCLLDNMEIELSKLEIFEGKRILKNSKERINSIASYYDSVISIQSKSVLNKLYNLKILFSRNLSNFISRNVPNMSAVLLFNDIEITFTTEFYKILRGFLDKNLGDQIIYDPDTIPLECLLRPAQDIAAENMRRFINFSFRISFDNVNVNLLTPKESDITYENLGILHFKDVLLSFDSYSENQSELSLVCHSILLTDLKNNDHVFKDTLILKNNSDGKNIYAEIHVLMVKDMAPTVTFILQNIRILCIINWYMDIKDFILLSSDFIPPTEEEIKKSKEYNSLFNGQDSFINKNVSVMIHERKHTISLKLQLTDTDFIFFEDPSDKKSLSLILSSTAYLNLNDFNGQLNINFDVKNMEISWAIYTSENDTICLLSTPLKFTVNLGCETEKLTLTEVVASTVAGINLEEKLPKHLLIFSIEEPSFRLSYKDGLVVSSVVNGIVSNFKKVLKYAKWKPPPNNNPTAFNSIKIKMIQINLSKFSFWFLDDFEGPAIPVIRIRCNDMVIENINHDINIKGSIEIEYYNNKFADWEPLLDPVKIDYFSIKQSKEKIEKVINCKINKESSIDFNITTNVIHLIDSMSKQLPNKIKIVDTNFEEWCRKERTNQVSYTIKNDTDCDISFTYQVDKIHSKDPAIKKSVKWLHVGVKKNVEFLLPISRSHLYDTVSANQNKLAIFINGYEEFQTISIESIRTFIINVKRKNNEKFKSTGYKTKLLISITMDKEGRKNISIKSAYTIVNYLTVPFMLRIDNTDYGDLGWDKFRIEKGGSYCLPLNYTKARIYGRPLVDDMEKLPIKITEYVIINFSDEYFSKLYQTPIVKKFCHENDKVSYSYISSKHDDNVCTTKDISGQCIGIFSPLVIRNQLPTDFKCIINGNTYSCKASETVSMIDINVEEEMEITFMTDKFVSINNIKINKEMIKKHYMTSENEKSLIITLEDEQGRQLDIYANIFLAKSGFVVIVVWVTYWIVNKSGIPLIVKKRGSSSDVAGQLSEHEQGKDKKPLMISFKDDEELKKCKVRIGNEFVPNSKYVPEYSSSFNLTPGEQSLVLYLKHEAEPTLIYNIGVEIKQGTGRYKNTQVIIFASRYILLNRSSHKISVIHSDDLYLVNRVTLEPKSNLVWNESFEDNKMICIKRDDVKYWSQSFKINQVDSFHVNMRAYDETPNFIRVEITLKNARFCIKFTDADLYPPPIQIINDSQIPVLYHQHSEFSVPSHLRSICKAHSKVNYSWDNLYDKKLLTLQASSYHSNIYDLSKPSFGPTLQYENHSYIFLKSSIKYNDNNYKTIASMKGRVLSVCDNNRIRLCNIQKNALDNTQLWDITEEGYIESVSLKTIQNGMTISYVLDINKEGNNYGLIVNKKDESRRKTQLWNFDKHGRLKCELIGYCLKKNDRNYLKLERYLDSTSLEDISFMSVYQKEGDGVLDVKSSYEGPTLVVRISECTFKTSLNTQSPTKNKDLLYDINLFIPKGIGISLINSLYEEIIYGRFCKVYLNVTVKSNSYESTLNVKSIQIDNEIKGSKQFHFFHCESSEERYKDDFSVDMENDDTTNIYYYSLQPALKVELNWSQKENYDSFECLRILFSDINVNLDELLLWKLLEFIQESGTADKVLSDNLNQPPTTDLNCANNISARRCYFGNLHLKVGNVVLSINTIPFNCMPKKLRKIKSNFNIKLISFENAIISLPSFKQEHTFETFSFLAESLSKFYINELKAQTFKIIVSLDAFGNPLGLATDIKDGFQELVFEGNLTGFVSGFGYGVANSFSKVVASVADGIGTLTYDEKHELLRRKAIKTTSETNQNNPLTYIYSGFKGLGVGVIGGITAIASNTAKETQKEGIIVGSVKGISTGVVDTFTKPIQGVFDFIECTALAMKEIAGSGYMKKNNTPSNRLRLPRVCSNITGLLIPYNSELAEAQSIILNRFNSSKDVVDFYIYHEQTIGNDLIQLCAIICYDNVFFIKRTNYIYGEIVNEIQFKYLLINEPIIPKYMINNDKFLSININMYNSEKKIIKEIQIMVASTEKGEVLCKKLNKVKEIYDNDRKNAYTF